MVALLVPLYPSIATLTGWIGEILSVCTSVSMANVNVEPLKVSEMTSACLVDVMLLASILTIAPVFDIE